MTEISKSTKSELNRIKRELDEPYIEDAKSSIIENKLKIKVKTKGKTKIEIKEFVQYRISIPKKLANLIKLNKKDFKAITSLDKEENALIIKIDKK